MFTTPVLKWEGYWTKIESTNLQDDFKDAQSAIMVNALDNTALRVCSSETSEPIKMLELLDSRFESNRTSSRISILTSLYSNKYNGNDKMAKYVDKFESVFSRMESKVD